MQFELAFNRAARLLKITFGGEVDGKQLAAATRKVRVVSSELKPLRALTDFSGVTHLHIESHFLSSLAHAKPTFDPDVVRAIVAPTDYLYGMARMFQSFGSETRPNLHIVRSLSDAYRVLGIDEVPEYEPLTVA